MRVFGKRFTSLDVGSGTDQVIGAFPLPRGSVLKNVWGEVHAVSQSEVLIHRAVMYGLSGHIVRVANPDASQSLQLLWDTQVPKAVDGDDVGDLSLDTTGNELANPEFEPGEMDIQSLYRVGNVPKEVFKRRQLITFASHGLGYEPIADTDSNLYHPADVFDVRVRTNYYVSEPSYILFGFSSPTLNAISNSQPVTLTGQEWIQYTYLEETLRDAQKYAMGGSTIDIGAGESPYDVAADLVKKIGSQVIFEETSQDFENTSWATKSKWTFEVSFPGVIGLNRTLSVSS